MAFTQQACQLRVVEGLTGFSNMSLPCFSTKAFALLASIESSQGSCTSSLTWSSATSTVPVVLCPRRLARKSRWSPDHWFLNTNKPAPLDWASLKLAFNLLNASSLPRRCGSVTMIGWAIYWFLSRTTPSKWAGYSQAPRSLKRRGLGLDAALRVSRPRLVAPRTRAYSEAMFRGGTSPCFERAKLLHAGHFSPVRSGLAALFQVVRLREQFQSVWGLEKSEKLLIYLENWGACHAGGRGFESRHSRHLWPPLHSSKRPERHGSATSDLSATRHLHRHRLFHQRRPSAFTILDRRA